ncbi:glucose dehydrogenase [Maricaulis sp. W15]|uniref:PQQ-dependent sugar dehydrogenase n=1 Tax=Maricaulis sp. W15 TaxID=1772333 RepID=UPI000948C3D0|nr:PQQ-dependent sugar dehydrogenase [Maricaulis sp. W15]OLF71326.1 glucose dehydrogenase [Maricaulis sp. W15]
MRSIISVIIAGMLMTSAASAQTLETRVSGLEYPWSLAFLPDGRMLVTEKPGRLRIVDEAGLVATPVGGVPDVLWSGQGGLLDVALSPGFETDHLVYLSWSGGSVDDNTLYLGRGRLQGGTLVDFEVVFEAMPHRRTDVHYGGRIAMIPAEADAPPSLLIGIGDGFDYREEAQNPDTHFGTFVHLLLDGQPVQRTFEQAAPGVISIGHRNPQAVVHDAVNRVIYSHEHGPRGGDEINILEASSNYGWPITSHGIDYTGALVTPFEAYAGMAEPLHVWVPSIAPSGMELYQGEMFPEWHGDLLVAALIPGDAGVPSGHVRRVDLDDGDVVGEEILFGEVGARIRDVRVGPDGAVWLLTDEADGRLIRVSRD